MDIRNTRLKRGIFEIVFYVFIIGLIISLSIFAGFSLGGFKESFFANIIEISSYLGSYLIYIPLLIIALILIIYPIMNMIFIRKNEHPATQDKSGWLRIFTVSYIYNPEDGFLWYLAKKFKERKAIKWTTNIMRVVFLSVLVSLLIGILITFNPQLAVSGVPQTAQQITPTSDIIFGAGIPSVAENGALLFILFFLLGIDAFLCSKFIKNKEVALLVFFMVALLVICPITSTIWMKYHSIVYGHSEASLLATWIFAYLGSALTIISGIFLWWLFLHFFNNLVLKLLEVSPLGSDLAIYLIIAWFLIFVTYISLEIAVWRRKRKSREAMITS